MPARFIHEKKTVYYPLIRQTRLKFDAASQNNQFDNDIFDIIVHIQ